MKIKGVILGLVLMAWLPARAQVTVEVTMEQEQFLAGEGLPTAVRITNRSGQTLRFGNEPDWLVFSIESSDGFVVVKTSEVPVLGEFAVESSQMATRRVDLAPHFVLSRTGRYKVTATVRVKEWDTLLNSAPRPFDIIHGGRLWAQEFGVPLAPGITNEAPEVRKYILQQANYLRTQLRLYLRLTDASESRLIKVFPIGPMVSFSRPEPQLDRFSNLHLLFQDGARSFNYTVVNPDGEVVLRQTYEYLNTRPRLQTDDSGKFLVAGGVRRPAPTDLPPPEALGKP